jgi:hypothetical protein
MAHEHDDPRAKHPVLLPFFGVLIATFLVGLLVHGIERDAHAAETATVLPYGN